MFDRDVIFFILGLLWTLMLATEWGRSVLLLIPWRLRRKEKRNMRIQDRIDLIVVLSASPVKALAYFCAKGFALITLFLGVFFFAILMVLVTASFVNGIGFFVCWAMLVFAANEPFDIAVKLRNPEKSIEALEAMKRK